MWRTDSSEKTLVLGKTEGRRRRGRQRMRWLCGITNMMDMSWVGSRSWWWTGKPGMLESMGLQRVRHDWVTELTPPLFLHPVLSLINICLNLPCGTQERSRRLNEVYFLQRRNGAHGKNLCLGGPQRVLFHFSIIAISVQMRKLKLSKCSDFPKVTEVMSQRTKEGTQGGFTLQPRG